LTTPSSSSQIEERLEGIKNAKTILRRLLRPSRGALQPNALQCQEAGTETRLPKLAAGMLYQNSQYGAEMSKNILASVRQELGEAEQNASDSHLSEQTNFARC
jgi:hypothetical protein